MYEIPILLNIQNRLWAMGWVMGVIMPLLFILVIQNARRNHLLRSILRTLELNPEVKFERRLAAAERRAVR